MIQDCYRRVGREIKEENGTAWDPSILCRHLEGEQDLKTHTHKIKMLLIARGCQPILTKALNLSFWVGILLN